MAENIYKRIRRAFTLIELLVVIAIIAVLVAILFPVIVEAKKTAKQMVCLTQMHEIGLAIHLYLSDNDEYWPGAVIWSPLPGYAPQQKWIGYDNNNFGIDGGFYGRYHEPAKNKPRPGAIDIYLQNNAIKKCPVQPIHWQGAYATNWWNNQYYSSYYSTNPGAQNNEWGPMAKITTYSGGLFQSFGCNQSEVQDPAATLIMWEHEARVPMCNFLFPYNWYEAPPHDPYLINHFHFLHRQGANAVWADGHAKRMVYGYLKRPYFSCRKDIYPTDY